MKRGSAFVRRAEVADDNVGRSFNCMCPIEATRVTERVRQEQEKQI